MLLIIGCGSVKNADKIFINGNIWTGIKNAPRAEFIAILGESILNVGNGEYKHLQGPSTELIDLHGDFVIPGLMDNHTHFMSGGFQLMSIDLRDAKSKIEFVKRIKEHAKQLDTGEWITGGDWDHEIWGGELPTRNWIDEVTENNPVFISRVDGHMALANSIALNLAGINAKTQNPPGGLIVRETTTNQPTGVLKDEARSLVSMIIPGKSNETLDKALKMAMEHAASLGVTQVHDMCSWEDLQTFERNRSSLTLRIYALPWYTNWRQLIELNKEKGPGNDWLRWSGMKAMMDGSLGSRTAWMHDPYLDDPSTKGLLVMADTLEFRKIMREVDRAGIQLAVHAIGTKANEWILDAFVDIEKENGYRDRRSRIEHSQHLTSNSINRFNTQNVIPSMQPYHCIDDTRWMYKRIGPEIMEGTYVFRSFLDKNVNLTFGSDWTVAPLNPMAGIYAAVTRKTIDGSYPGGWYPEQRITVEEALHCYTNNSAYAGFQEDKLGSLESGKLADFVVLSNDLTRIEPDAILNTIVLRTIVGGMDAYIRSAEKVRK
jgi:predicted amidohydrolase YtcJ